MTLRHWIAAARPNTLWAGAVPVVVGSAMAYADGGWRPVRATLALAVAIGLQLASNFVNDAADGERGVDGPDRLGPPRALAMGWLSASALKAAALACVAVSVAAGAWLAWISAPWLMWAGAAAAACAVLYTAGPVPLGYIGLGDVLVLLFFGVMAVCGTYFVQVGTVGVHVFAASLAVGALATAILVVNNLRDRHQDAARGKWTLAARFGARFARIELTLLLISAFALVATVGALRGAWGWWLPWLASPAAVWLGRQVWRRDGRALNPLLGATARLELAFGVLLSLGVLL